MHERMNDFIVGQRWICDADLQLGLGTVMAVEARLVSISFIAVGETRTYAKRSAPLTRVIFSANDTVTSHEGWTLKVASVKQYDGLLSYIGTDQDGNELELAEQHLAHFLKLSRPTERLLNGHIDPDQWFQIRYQALRECSRLAQTTIHGLTGCRTSLIPHQLYIAHEVANRYAPRVLLADEVGLGKTIEAGLILHHQLLTEHAKRILIVVPESLVHQWLVEMLRRFNLHFSIFDEVRYATLKQSDDQENPFHSEQLILCGLDFLKQSPQHLQAALAGDWDLLVVDEAHHLQWSEREVSPEYSIIEQLAARTKGVILLTATPEQLGKASHFARLRLLDPDRFTNFDHFIEEELSYQPLAKAVEALLNGEALDGAIHQMMASIIQEEDTQRLLTCLRNTPINSEENNKTRKTLIALLLDRHGTGRILFRNTRATIKGFPARKLIAAPLTIPQLYRDCLTVFEAADVQEPQLLLCPEQLYQVNATSEDPHWTQIDPRIDWLNHCLKQLKPEKVLVITANMQTALDIAQTLKVRTGLHVPVFHEHMNLVARDRAAAFFANQDEGSQVLVCSEIGSEGRNFQFAHHLILFDLPLNPDLLEQRIGRLDRIGQTETIQIHVPYIEHTAQAVIFHWYHQGLNAFKQPCHAGQAVFQQMNTALKQVFQHSPSEEMQSQLINTTQIVNQTLNEALHQGRDKLLEYNSFRPDIANKLIQQAMQEDMNPDLPLFMDAIFDCFGVEIEDHRTGSYKIQPSERMTAPFPGLADEGMIITYDRNTALANENFHYLTWVHPTVVNAIDRVVSSEFGNASVSTMKCEQAKPPGTLYLESLYVLDTYSDNVQQSNRYLPPTIIRIFLDEHGNSEYPDLNHETVNQYLSPVSSEIAKQVVELKKTSIKELVSTGERLAQVQVPAIIKQAQHQINQFFTQEINRLKALHKINPNVRKDEVLFFERQLESLSKRLESANLRLDAIRIIVAT
jgi:ATP-dependent helicase HepA